MNTYKTSQSGINLIKEFEGYSPNIYEDVVGKKTIGYGHLIKPGEIFCGIMLEQAERILAEDLYEAEKAVHDLVKEPVSQNEFDALVSFTFNLGRNALKNSTLLRLLNAGSIEAAADQFLRWDHAGGKVVHGLTRRRVAERSMFLRG
jgi:GH24 family phage-related lysozyme (muramidase)